MKNEHKITQEYFKEFYSNIGQLSINFAKMEYSLLCLLSTLISQDSFINLTILENNSLSKNLDYLKKVNKHREFEVDSINNLISNINQIKTYRNLFIHGLWLYPVEIDNDISIDCLEPRIQHKIEGEDQSWSNLKPHELKLSLIKNQIQTIEEITFNLDRLKREYEKQL